MHRPPVASNACSCVHSALLVGLDSGMMTGRSLISAMACSTSVLKACKDGVVGRARGWVGGWGVGGEGR